LLATVARDHSAFPWARTPRRKLPTARLASAQSSTAAIPKPSPLRKAECSGDTCAEYFITARPKGERPFQDHWKNGGDLKCEETDKSKIGGEESILHGTCTCWYANYPGHLDTFKMPKSGKCSDVHPNDLQ
jgi:hypothetical protein